MKSKKTSQDKRLDTFFKNSTPKKSSKSSFKNKPTYNIKSS